MFFWLSIWLQYFTASGLFVPSSATNKTNTADAAFSCQSPSSRYRLSVQKGHLEDLCSLSFSLAPKSHLSSHMFVPSSAINEHIYLCVADACFLLSITFNDSTLCSKVLETVLCSFVFLWLQKIRRRSHVCAIFFTQNRIYIAKPSGLCSSHKSPTLIS